MMNIDNSGIENTQSDDTTSVEIEATETESAIQADADYEAAFEAELKAEGLAQELDGELEAGEAEDMVGEHYRGDADAEALEAVLDTAEDAPEAVEVQAEAAEDTAVKEPKGPPAYVSFIAAVEAHAKALGLTVKEQKSYFQYLAASGHKMYIEKALKKGVSRIDTSLPRAALIVNGKDISLPLAKPNGRIACHIDPSIESVKQALAILATYEDKIPAPKKPVAKAQPAA